MSLKTYPIPYLIFYLCWNLHVDLLFRRRNVTLLLWVLKSLLKLETLYKKISPEQKRIILLRLCVQCIQRGMCNLLLCYHSHLQVLERGNAKGHLLFLMFKFIYLSISRSINHIASHKLLNRKGKAWEKCFFLW